MSCTSYTLKGIAKDCSQSMGGIKNIYIANYSDVTAVSVSGDTITGVTMVSGATFHGYALRKGAAQFTSTATIDNANGINYVTTDLVFNMLKMDTTKRVEMSALSVNELAVIVEDANGVFWYLGKDEPVTATTGTGATGQQRTDGNMYSVTLQDTSLTYPFEINATVVAGLID